MTKRGAHEGERNLANKICRGTFSAAFFMMCMDVICVRPSQPGSLAQAQRAMLFIGGRGHPGQPSVEL
ncbi:DUF6471 domain-containing protein [Mesorhizobium delmotii]|uniref:DUF6471 domain-containing protein n=1 Tax=Mesorhizobium delmotii TaxID=1631247 RepID=UPI0024535C29|nr:DUF6471 domain-containing protein [Mesorhizobium delmotii]